MTEFVRDLENTFGRAWKLLRLNPVIVLPGLVLGTLGGAASFAVDAVLAGTIPVSTSGEVNYVAQIIIGVVTIVVALLTSIVQMAFVTGMAGAAWRDGRASIADGWNAFTHRSIQMSIGALLLFAIGMCAAVLAPATFFVTLAIYTVFLIYTMASVVIGGRDAVSAIAESCRVAFSNIVPTIGVVALIVLIAIGAALAGALIARVAPFAGLLVAGVLQQIIVAFASLVVVGEYLTLLPDERAALPRETR